eukprot:m.155041 g.155041  ORF g.155041 m.155041 type:complete len:317 (-) comp17924_c0_seq1:389-1339(-)
MEGSLFAAFPNGHGHANCTAVLDAEEKITESSTGIGIGFACGMFFSFVPQILKLSRRKSAIGISPLFSFCSTSMGIATFLGAAILQTQKFQCCTKLGHDRCGVTLVPLASLAVQLVCTSTVWLLVCTFTLRAHRLAHGINVFINPSDARIGNTDVGVNDVLPSLRVIKGLLTLWTSIIVVYLTLTLLFLYFFGANGKQYGVLGKVIASIGTVITTVQFLPQIATTFRLKDPGSFSLVTLAIQCPGSLGWASYLAFSANTNITVWLAPMATGAFQLILLIMCIVYTLRNRRLRSGPGGISSTIPTESQPLLSTQHGQ